MTTAPVAPVALTFDDVLLEPKYSEVKSRSLVDTSSQLVEGIRLKVPIISANMDTVTELEMARVMDYNGGFGIIHRFMTIEDQVGEISSFKDLGGKFVGAAIGIKDDCVERAEKCIEAGVDVLCLDVAHGHTKAVGDVLDRLRAKYPDLKIIAGNVASYDGAKYLIEHGASAVKVGVGPGSVCTTRIVAGVGVPQITAISNCAVACREAGIPLIADGGIRNPSDVAKAIAFGANTVMVGGLLARTKDSPGTVVERDGKLFKTYRGMASKSAMAARREIEVKHFNGASPEPRLEHVAPEGVETLVPYTEQRAKDVLNYLVGGLKSAMSYSNALSIDEFQKQATYIQITRAGLTESQPHAILSV